jgi:hypothetical protein
MATSQALLVVGHCFFVYVLVKATKGMTSGEA